MTPLTNEVLEALPNKKRTELLRELKAACNEMKDTITGARFDRMRKKQLHLIVKLGKSEGKKRCYYVRSLYKMWQQATAGNKPFVNPETREKVTEAEKADIFRKMQYVKRGAQNPEDVDDIKVDSDLILEFVPLPGYYKIWMIRRFGNKVYLIYNLGLIPSDIDIAESGSSDITSAVAVTKLTELFNKGRLMQSNFIPYNCCTIHLGKRAADWSGDRVAKLANMLEEINRLL
jgi:hypothetical protein